MAGKQPTKQQRPIPTSATGEKQTIQARHGTATFVPKGFSIKIINTYGRQVVDTWAFALNAPPEEEDFEDEKQEEEEVKETVQGEQSKEDEKTNDNVREEKTGPSEEDTVKEVQDKAEAKDDTEEGGTTQEEVEKSDTVAGETDVPTSEVEKSKEDVEDESKAAEGKPEEEATATDQKATEKAPEEVPAKLEGSGSRRWSAYIPSVRGLGSSPSRQKEKQQKEGNKAEAGTSKGWSAYIPNVPSIRAPRASEEAKDKPTTDATAKDATGKEQKTWASYIPSGQGFSPYLPSKDTLSAFAASHQRDPTKSIAEQLYDFSKTPVGAAGISVASGSGYASSIYAAYSAYNQTVAARSASDPGMEYMSMPHSRASTQHLSPRVGDVLVSNLRAPLLTLVEDSSPGTHDTLIAACDPQRYKQLGVEKWEEHGSCAENLVLALHELNKSTGLKGRKAIGRDVSVNSVPAPLNLFMNIPWTAEGDVSFEPPKGKRGDYVRLRAERDVVVVMSACPQDILEINAKKPMVAHFVVESPLEEDKKVADAREFEAQRIIERARKRTERPSRPLSIVRALSTSRRHSRTPEMFEAPQKTTERGVSPDKTDQQLNNGRANPAAGQFQESEQVRNVPQRGRNKPRKLQRRTSSRS